MQIKNSHFVRKTALLLYACVCGGLVAVSQTSAHYQVSIEGALGSGDFNPYYLSSNRHGILSTEANTGYLRAAIDAQHQSKYTLWETGIDIQVQKDNYNTFYLQQLYAAATWRWAYLHIGSRQYEPIVRNFELSSGSTVWSGNARPIPQVKLGTNGFISIPGTHDWVQVYFDGSYGYTLDGDYQEKRYAEYLIGKEGVGQSFITTDVWYHQKKIYFRSNPIKRWVITAGLEHSVQFGGHHRNLGDPNVGEAKYDIRLSDFFKVLKPTTGGKNSNIGDRNFAYGNHLGNISLDLEYKISSDHIVKVYVENLFEDGSAMAKRNGWDGLWGFEYIHKGEDPTPWIKGIVLEYLQTTDQSGPIHWAPSDFSLDIETALPDEARGADDYYNNYLYTGYSHFGQSCGSPMLKSPAYNEDSYLRFAHTRVKAYHLGINGYIAPNWEYKLLLSHRDAWGTPYVPSLKVYSSFSSMAEVRYQIKSWTIKASLANDSGSLYGDNTAFNFSISKSGNLFQ